MIRFIEKLKTMKKLLLILLCVPIIVFGQDNDILTLQNEVEDINYRIDKHHQQFKKGVVTWSAGTIVATTGILLTSVPVIVIGGIGQLVGLIVGLDSHKWFGNKKKYFRENYFDYEKSKNNLIILFNSGQISVDEYNKKMSELNDIMQFLETPVDNLQKQ